MLLNGTGCAVAGLGDEGAHPEGLVRELAVDAEAARHRDAHGRRCDGRTALAREAELERPQMPPPPGPVLPRELPEDPGLRLCRHGPELEIIDRAGSWHAPKTC